MPQQSALKWAVQSKLRCSDAPKLPLSAKGADYRGTFKGSLNLAIQIAWCKCLRESTWISGRWARNLDRVTLVHDSTPGRSHGRIS